MARAPDMRRNPTTVRFDDPTYEWLEKLADEQDVTVRLVVLGIVRDAKARAEAPSRPASRSLSQLRRATELWDAAREAAREAAAIEQWVDGGTGAISLPGKAAHKRMRQAKRAEE